MSKVDSGTTSVPQCPQRKIVSLAVAALFAAAGTMLIAPTADARITKIQITTKESPTFGGFSFGAVGQYEKLQGKAFGELDPNDPRNAVIVDIALAPRNANGKVEYSHDFYILKPIDLSKGNHKVFYEPPNRGGKQFGSFNRTTGGNDPSTTTNPGGAFLWPRGYTYVASGWDASAGTSTANNNLTITLPVAKNPDGTSIIGPVYEYIVNDNATTMSSTLTYTPATLNKSLAKLTTRAHLNDVPVVIPDSGWDYNAAGTAISLLPAGTAFTQSNIYEFTYQGKDPTVNGVGFAAVRDFNAFLRYAMVDDAGVANPLAGDVQRMYTYVVSQPGRFLNDFRWLGFNEAENRNIVFDGMLNWIAAGHGINMNNRFSQPGRTNRNRQQLLYEENVFPFAANTTTDPITGKTDGRYARCTASGTCPVGMEIYSANEYWVKNASLLHTNPQGTADLPDHAKTRNYFISSHQHGTGNGTTKGICQQLSNPLDSSPIQRALFVDMDQWVTANVAPPPSAVPKLSDGTLVPPLPQSGVGFPNIPGVMYTGLRTTGYLFNYGPRYRTQGIMDINPPVINPPYQDNPANGPFYTSLVPKTDSDGNDIAGIRLPDVAVPLATFTGWALRAPEFGGPDGCEATGQKIPFALTKAERIASGDPRLSIEERYGNFQTYYYLLTNAIDQLGARRLILAEDAWTMLNQSLNRALAAQIPRKSLEEDMQDDEGD
jgi:hypothetical protein